MKNNFSDLWANLSTEERAELATNADTSVAYLSQIASGFRNAGNKTIKSLLAADSRITLAMFFEAA